MEEIGIAVRAKTELQEIINSIDTLGKLGKTADDVSGSFGKMSEESKKIVSDDLDSGTKKLLRSIKDLSKDGSKDLQKIKKDFDEISEKGKDASKEEIKNVKQLVAEYKTLANQKLTDMQVFESTAMRSFQNRLRAGGLTPEQEAGMGRMVEEMKGGMLSRRERATMEIMESRAGAMEQDVDGQSGAAAGGAWGSRMKTAGKFILGGSLVGAALYAVKHWADVDREMVKVEQRFGNIRKGVEGFGESLGYTKKESAEMAKIWGEITDRFDKNDIQQYTGFARHRGIDPTQAFQLRLAGRYVKGEGAREDLTGFERFAGQMGMSHGRIGELIQVTSRLSQMAAEQAFDLSGADIRGVQLFTRQLWEGSGNEERGKGQWGANFIQRLNAGMTGGGDAGKAFLMRAYGFGTGEQTLTQTMERMEAGIFGKGNIEDIMEQILSDIPGNRERQILAFKGKVPELKTKEVRQLFQQWGDTDERKKLVDRLSGKYGEGDESANDVIRDYNKLGQAAVSIADVTKVLFDKARYDTINESLDVLESMLKVDMKQALQGFIENIEKINSLLKSDDQEYKEHGYLRDVDNIIDKLTRTNPYNIPGG